MATWFRRLADIRVVGYPGHPIIDRRRLPGHDAEPHVSTYSFDGRRHEALSWDRPNGSTSASPAKEWQTKPRRGETTAQTALRQVHEQLELPGVPEDYHFALLGAYEALWKSRRQEPKVLDDIERLCWIDIRLIEAFPRMLLFEQPGRQVHDASFPAYQRLAGLYEQQGYLTEALEVLALAARRNAPWADLQPLRERLARLEADDAA